MKFTTDRIAEITGGTTVASVHARTVGHLAIDSRSPLYGADTMFCAIKAADDGHRYIPVMYSRGVRAFLVTLVPDDATAAYPDAVFISVGSVEDSIGAIARAHRAEMKNTRFVAITGSVGKTVVKELFFSALSPVCKVVRSPRSWNSRIGVPLSICGFDTDADVAIVEAGIDRPGTMDTLEEIIRPDVGILTPVTEEHDEGFESRRQKIAEKKRLFRNCPTVIEVNGKDNRPAVIAAARALGYNVSTDGIEEVSNRIDVHEGVNDCVMLCDNFTGDIGSLDAALDFMSRRATATRRNTVIMTDMMHGAGDDPADIYRRAARSLAAAEVTRVVTIGPETASYKAAFTGMETESVASADDFARDYDINSFSSETILIFGSDNATLRKVRELLESPRHDTTMEIDLDAVIHNFNTYRSMLHPGVGLVAMVKASAYGIGAVETAKTLQAQGAAYLAVAVVDEGVELRRGGITMPIMVLNPITGNYRALFDYNLEPAVFSLRELDTLCEAARRAGAENFRVHIKLDTGMHRVGFTPAELPELIERLKAVEGVRVASVFSHLATADCLDMDYYTEMQLHTYDEMSGKILAALPYRVLRHVLNTAGIMRYPEYQYDMVRLGIGLYGVSPLPGDVGLRPVATLKSTVISLHSWPAGTTVGYGCRGKLTRPSVIATVPVGYADGVDRHLSRGAASFAVRGHECPTVGNICMDQCMIDVTDVPDVAIGDTVEIFGRQMPVEKLADILGTIPYELLTSVAPRVRRIYYRE